MEELKASAREASQLLDEVRFRMEEVIRGKTDVIEQVLTSLLAGGHILMEDLPGMGKTTLAYTLAKALHGDFSRIQFTSDLLPSDVLGVSVFNERTREFEFKPGPVFAQIVLADEINRSTPKTQSALLEVMDRGKISLDGETHSVGEPFLVFATQNPVDFEGTFPLPDSQMDRFLLRLQMGYPDFSEEKEILRAGMRRYDQIQSSSVVSLEKVRQWQCMAETIFVEDSLLNFLLTLVAKTRKHSAFRTGISPRGALSLLAASKARAFRMGRVYVLPEDIAILFPFVCGHRLRLISSPEDPLEARAQVESLLQEILEDSPLSL